MLLSMVPKEQQHPPAGERWQLRLRARGVWFGKAAARLGRPEEVTETGPRWMAATRRLAVCIIRLPVNFGDFEATGLLSTATSNPDDERHEIQIIWMVSKVPFSTLVISIKLVSLRSTE